MPGSGTVAVSCSGSGRGDSERSRDDELSTDGHLAKQRRSARAHDSFAVQGKMTEAAVQFAEAVRLNPQNANARRNMARALSKLGRLDEARTHELEAQRLENQQRSATP